MTDDILFVSDLHLGVACPERVRCFLDFLAGRAQVARDLYILGDLFDAYIGDDDERFPNRDVREGLRRLAASGTRVHLQHGNRDFLIGQRFCRGAGAALLGDYALVDIHGARSLLTHGDLLCSDDVQYQRARQRVRTESWKRAALAKPLLARRLYARWYRFRSGRDKSGKSHEIMDVNQGTVAETMRRFGVARLIHGHTHRPGVHEFELDGSPAQRIVLAEWLSSGQVLVWRKDGFRIETVPAA